MSTVDSVFANDEERTDFYIALPVIALFGVLSYIFIFAPDDQHTVSSVADSMVSEVEHSEVGATYSSEASNRPVRSDANLTSTAAVAKSNKSTRFSEPSIRSTATSALATDTIPADSSIAVALEKGSDIVPTGSQSDEEIAKPDTAQMAVATATSAATKDAELTPGKLVSEHNVQAAASHSDSTNKELSMQANVLAKAESNSEPETISTPDTVTVSNMSGADEQTIKDAGFNILFNQGTAELTSNSRSLLLKVAETLKRYPDIKLEAHGFTDSLGSPLINKQISQSRAQACIDIIAGAGIDPSRLKAIGFGEERAIASNETPDGRRANRRVEFKLIQ